MKLWKNSFLLNKRKLIQLHFSIIYCMIKIYKYLLVLRSTVKNQIKKSLSFLSTISLYQLLYFDRSSSGDPNSTTWPFSITNILSELDKVDNRCAIVKTVQVWNLSLITCWIAASFLLSILAVASSTSTILLCFRKALQMQRSCFYPADKLSFETIA